jgi:hypothetical protein
MRWVWTKQAEKDFIAKWGNSRPLTRKAGTTATYDGKDLNSMVIPAYRERGWITCTNDEPYVPETRGYRRTNFEQEKVREERWKQLQQWLSHKNVPSVTFVATNMGLSSGEVLTNFVKNYGANLAQKFGKLPHFKGGQGQHLSEAWLRVMEAKKA